MDRSVAGLRARRALPLIATALAVTVVASLLYLRTNSSTAVHVAHPSLGPLKIGNFYAVYDFVTPSLGWAAIQYQQPIFWIFNTSDGASHWHRQYTGVANPGPIKVQFFDADNGIVFMLSTESTLMRTRDAGAHWTSLKIPAQVIWLAFADQDIGWAIAGQFNTSAQRPQLFATSDGGASWLPRQWPAGASAFTRVSWYDLHFRADLEGWLGATAAQPAALLTLDGGQSWQQQRIQIADQYVAGPYTTETNLLPGGGVIAFASDNAGKLSAFATFDLGQTWRPIKAPPPPARLQDITFFDSNRWWAMTTGHLFKTADAGQSWTQIKLGPLEKNWNYLPAVIIDANHAWSQMIFALSPRPVYTALAMTSNAGATWITVNVPNLDVGQ